MKCIWHLVRYSTIPLHSEATTEAVHMNKFFHSHFYSLLAPQIKFYLKNKIWHNINVVFHNTQNLSNISAFWICSILTTQVSSSKYRQTKLAENEYMKNS